MTSAVGPEADGDGRLVSDAAGVVILGACAAWSLISATARDGRPEGVLLAVLAVTAGYAAGRIGGAVLPVAAPGVAALAGTGLTVAVPHLAPGPQLAAPLGHAGATAALLTLATGAACCGAWASGVPAVRLGLRLLAAGIAVTAAALGSATGCVACAVVLLCSLAAGHVRHRGTGIAALVLVVALVTALTWALAANALPAGLTASLERPLTSHRVQLWRDAVHMVRQEAALGIGPGRFGELSPTAALSLPPDIRPHSAPLQQAAEQGVVGVALLGAAFCWLLFALWRSPRPTPVALTAGVALTALATIATLGNALSFTAVTAGAGLLAGLATAHPLADEPPTRTTNVRPRGDRLSR
ncbi:O-antigen ligase family protein [Streptomyces sp. S.PNR 29]|uniref:O-antigen ligase family protein n=1 Tax=Streptomyces sp. S.PNR 29 TaxID=2973805 RepID=UPI0025AFC633|nr:O-antigen ligase family protein [Streptomyces sp. S.PNR 29]MDN0196375.1 O-antigen ligase family protein [Streptomyces sp. S.PNR 29]